MRETRARWRRRAFLGLASAAWASAQEAIAPELVEARRLILDASRALQAGNAGRFLGCFDKRALERFDAFSLEATALIETRTVGSSVDVVLLKAREDGVAAEVDWLLQLTPLRGPGPVETRRETVRVVIRPNKKGKARIVSLEPRTLFRATLD